MDNTPVGRVKPHSLVVAFFNADGLTEQIDEVREFVCARQIDILLVQETFLKPSRRNPNIANYNIIRNDRTDGRLGGTAIYYRKSLHCTPLDPPALEHMEVSVCRVSMSGHPSVILASVYLSGSKQLTESDLTALLAMGDSVILAGDFNAKHTSWNSRVTNQRGRMLDSLADRPNFNFVIFAPDTPTRYPYPDRRIVRPDVLDIALLKNVALQVSSLEVLSELDSDHRPVLMHLGPQQGAGHPLKRVIDYKKLAERLQSTDPVHLARIPDEPETLVEANAASLHLARHILDAVGDCSKEMPIGPNRRHLPEDARQLISIKNARRRAHDKDPTDENRRELWRAQREVKARLAELRDEDWDRKLGELSPSHVAYYRLARSLKAEPVAATPPLVRPNLPLAFEDIDKAECLADSLEEQCSPSVSSIDKSHVRKVESDLDALFSRPLEGDPITPTSSDEVHKIIKDLVAKKSSGPDSISNRTLKLLPGQIINLLVVIFNILLTHCAFPNEWKEAVVIGIRKPGKPGNLPSSYRPISLLNSLAKVYERLILARLRGIVESQKLLNDEQFGFRAKHSCVHQAHRVTEHIYAALQRFQAHGQVSGAVFFDVAKAFDRVWHAGLLYKLFHLGVPDRLVHLIRAYLTDRSFRYRLDGTLSSSRIIRAGVPQGSVLSPLLYALFTSDIPRAPHVNIAQYADDTALYSSHINPISVKARLQKAVNLLGDWFRRWRIEVNPSKSAAVMFHKTRPRVDRRLSSQNNTLKLFGSPIPWTSQVKYLGVTFDMRMNFRAHIHRVRNKAKYVLSRLYPMLCAKSKMSLRHKVTLYKVCIRPILTYAGVVFAHLPHAKLQPLQSVQNKFMRIATGSPWFVRNMDLHRDLDLPTIAQHLKQLSKVYFEKAAKHSNPLVVDATNYPTDRNDPPDKRRPKHVLIDPDDQTTTDNALYDVGLHTPTKNLQRLRRRRRGPRFLTSPGRGTHPRTRGRPDWLSPPNPSVPTPP